MLVEEAPGTRPGAAAHLLGAGLRGIGAGPSLGHAALSVFIHAFGSFHDAVAQVGSAGHQALRSAAHRVDGAVPDAAGAVARAAEEALALVVVVRPVGRAARARAHALVGRGDAALEVAGRVGVGESRGGRATAACIGRRGDDVVVAAAVA